MALYGGADPFELIKHMTIREALNFGLVNKEVYNLTKTEKFWLFFLNRDYPYFVIDGDENPESSYRKIYDNRKAKKITMKSGETFKQFRYHQNINSFDCSNNELKSLIGCPPCKILYCFNNQLTSLVGCPPCKILECSDNRLISLVGCPASIKKLGCRRNRLTSLIGCPPEVDDVDFTRNRLTSLDGCSQKIKRLGLSYNQLTSLKGCSVSVEILSFHENLLQTLDIHLPKINIIKYTNNPLVYPWDKYSKEQITEIMRNSDYHS